MYVAVYLQDPDPSTDTKPALIRCIEAVSPLYDVPEAGIAVLDLRGLGKLFGDSDGIASAISKRVEEAGFRANVAIAANLDSAIAAAKGFPGVTVIPSGNELRVLAPLQVSIFSPGEDVAETLVCWGIRTLGELAALPEKGVAERLGPEGLYLQKLARGWVRRPLVPYVEKLRFEDSIDLEHPLDLLEPLSFLLSRLLNGLCAKLMNQGLATNEIELTLDLDDGTQFGRKLNLPFASCDSAAFLKLLQYDVEAHPPGAPICKVALKFTPVPPRRLQTGLFTPLAPEPEKLELTLARIAGIVGEGNVGSPEVLNTHRPDAYRIVKFDANANAKAEPQPVGSVHLAIRQFRPPLPARVDDASGTPVRIASRGVTGKIVSYAGPWRTSGEWWKTDSWDRDEWDVGLDNGTLYRIFRDRQGNWFVDGNYD